MNVTQTYKPGDTFLEYVTVPADASVVATLWRNGSSVGAGVSVSSPVVDQQCTISFDIPSDWSAGDIIVVQLRGTSEEEGLDEPETYKFQLEAQTLSEVGTLAKQEEILSAIDGIEGGTLPEETIEKIDFIYEKFTVVPPGTSAVVVPDASKPGMVVLVVQLRHGSAMQNGLSVKATMKEAGPVSLDGAYEVKKSYEEKTAQHTISGSVMQGVALVELFSSPKLQEAGYNPLYEVVAPGVRRTVWIPEGGGVLDVLTDEPSEE